MSDDDVSPIPLVTDARGKQVRVGSIRQNGKVVLSLSPAWTSLEPEPDLEAEEAWRKEVREELCSGLNALERRTWERIMDGVPLISIAKEEGVEGSAIYARIRGKGVGGMVAKNPYVARWWALRLRRQLAEKIARRKSKIKPKAKRKS